MGAVEHGYCYCGCGQQTKLAPRTRPECGWIKGEPTRFILGHHRRGYRKHPKLYELDKKTGCWNWLQAINKDGYGVLGVSGKTLRAHRYIYEKVKGPIPEGLVLDHLCKNRKCVNPDHLEPVTVAENTARGARKYGDEHLNIVLELSRQGFSTRRIAVKTGISKSTVHGFLVGAVA